MYVIQTEPRNGKKEKFLINSVSINNPDLKSKGTSIQKRILWIYLLYEPGFKNLKYNLYNFNSINYQKDNVS